MGFSVQLRILLPEAHPPPRSDDLLLPEDAPDAPDPPLCPPLPPTPMDGEPAVFRPVGTLDFGRVTRLQKLMRPEQFGPFRPFVRAAIGVVSVLRRSLEEAPREHFLAPPILAYDYEENGHPDRLPRISIDLGSARSKANRDWHRPTYPDLADRREHNLWVAASQDPDPAMKVAFQARLANHEPVLDPPFFWMSARELALRWDNARLLDDPEWIEVKKDDAAAAFWYAWSAYLCGLAAAQAQVLILFPRHGGDDVIG